MYDSLKITPKTRGYQIVFNHTNFHLYHYAGNNPIKYIDPDGRSDVINTTVELYDECVPTTRNNTRRVSYFTNNFSTTDKENDNMAKVVRVVNTISLAQFTIILTPLARSYEGAGSNYLVETDGFDYIKTAETEIKLQRYVTLFPKQAERFSNEGVVLGNKSINYFSAYKDYCDYMHQEVRFNEFLKALKEYYGNE